MDRVLDGMLNFNAETKETLDSIKETIDKVFDKHYQANHTPYAVMSFEDEAHYWEEQLANTIDAEYFDNVEEMWPTGVELLRRRSYVIIRGNLKSGSTIRFDNTKFDQLYINGERYTGDYTFNGETPEIYERLVIVAVQTPFNLGQRIYGDLDILLADFPIENAEIYMNIGTFSELQPNVEELLKTDIVESLYVNGNWMLKFSDYCPIRTLSITGNFSRATTFNFPNLENMYTPNSINVAAKTATQTYRNIDISNATGNIVSSAFSGSAIRGKIFLNKISTIESYAFEYCKGITHVFISNTCSNIYRSAFMQCTGLEEIIIPDSVTTLEDGAFSDCTSLKYAEIGDGVKTLPKQLFGWCTSLEEVVLGKSITSMYDAYPLPFDNIGGTLRTIRVRKGYHCPKSRFTSNTGIDWRCFKEVFENCAEIGENNRTDGDMVFRVSSNVLTAYDTALHYEGDDAELLKDKEIALQIAELGTTKRIKITT
jgi:hypothetical protein